MKIAIISDMHGETEGLRLALEDIKKQECDVIYCLGDMIHGGGSDEDVIKMVRENRIQTVFGNHELKHENILSDSATRFIDALPERIRIGHDIILSHASPLDRKKITCLEDSFRVFDEAEFRIGFVGHTHFPFVYEKTEDGVIRELERPYENWLEFTKNSQYLICVGPLGDQRSPKIPFQYIVFDASADKIRYSLLPMGKF